MAIWASVSKLALLGALLCAPAQAQATQVGTSGHPFGLGLAIGYPGTGISGKYFLGGRQNAIEGVVGAWSGRRGRWYLHGIYLWHPSVLARASGFELPWHVGVGPFVADPGPWRWRGDVVAGVRVPVGLDFDLTDVRLQFSGDVAANLVLVPDVFFDLSITISARYYF